MSRADGPMATPTLSRRRLLVGTAGLVALLGGVWWARRRGAVAELRDLIYVFGTVVTVTVRHADEAVARRAVAAVSAELTRLHGAWHAWRPGGVTRLNTALARGERLDVGAELADLVRDAQALSVASDGLFNPAIGALIGLWGFHRDDLPQGAPPAAGRVAALVAQAPSMADLSIDGTVIGSRNPAVQLDLGGHAKGAALDRAMALLAEHGIVRAVINAGGDLNVLGNHGDRPWRIGIRDPAGQGVIGTVTLGDGEVLYTSGNYERYREHDGVRYGHILDPRTGRPVSAIVSASVLHTRGAFADAAATALAVAGPTDWPHIARRLGVTQAVLVEADGTVHLTPTMRDRLRLAEDHAGAVVVTMPEEA